MTDQQIASSYRILNTALQTYKPSLVILSFSGGYDSMVSSHVSAQWARRYAHSTNVMTLAADTLISADNWTDFVQDTARTLRFPRMVVEATDHLDKWRQRIVEFGFPHTESQHRINFYYLKQVTFRRVIQQYKKFHHDRIMYVNGVRRAESRARANRPEMARQGTGVFVNAILHWTDEDVTNYRMAHDMPLNPFYDTFGNSGDCLCNWHAQLDLQLIERHAPKAYAILRPLHDETVKRFGYGYGQRPVPGFFEGTPQLTLPGFEETPYLCADCRKQAAKNNMYDDVAMQRFDWSKS